MSEAKHTPGPWSLKEVGGLPMQVMGAPTPKDPEYNPVTRFGTTFICPTSDETKANAHLIVAAPELLEALIACRAQWIHSANAEKCLAAIAKATGKEAV